MLVNVCADCGHPEKNHTFEDGDRMGCMFRLGAVGFYSGHCQCIAFKDEPDEKPEGENEE